MLPNIALFEGTNLSGELVLWETNGTAIGTFQFASIPGADPSGLSPNDLTVADGEVLFRGLDASGQGGLWATDGTPAGTAELTGIVGANTAGLDPNGLANFNNQVLFNGYDAGGLFGLWVTNGTAAGTQEVTGIAGAATTGRGLDPSDLTVFNGETLFDGVDSSGLSGLWETNGTAAGTSEIVSGPGGVGGLNPSDMAVFGAEILFDGVNPSGEHGLWETDGTAGGTHELIGVVGAYTLGLGPTDLTVLGDRIVFEGTDASGNNGLWVTDGTVVGTQELTGITGADQSGSGLFPQFLTAYDGDVLFAGRDANGAIGLWVTDGTVAGTQELTGIVGAATTGDGLDPSQLAVYDGEVLFNGLDSSGDDVLWVTNGTVSGTHELTGIGASTGVAPIDLTGIGTPELTAGASTSYVAGAAPIALDPGLSISDPEASSLIGATVSIGAGFVAADELRVASPQTGITSSYDATTGVLTLTGMASVAAYQTELASVAFTSPASTSPSRTMTWSVKDSISPPARESSGVSSSVSVLTAGLDLVLHNTDGQLALWQVNGGKVSAIEQVGSNPGSSWRAVGTGDFNDDGHPDILWQDLNTGQASIWETNGTSLIGGGHVSPNPGTNWRAVGTGDFNGDGFSDILWQNTSTGEVSVWEMNGTSLIGGGPVSPNPGTNWEAIGTGDFNKDGDSDILFQNTSTGQISIWEMNGNAVIGGGPVSPNPGPAWQAIGTGDFNQDGFSDILLQNKSTGQVSVWEMNGNTLIGGGPVANPGTSWHAIGTGGGGADILLQNTNGQTSIWAMNGTSIAGGGPLNPNPGTSWHAVALT